MSRLPTPLLAALVFALMHGCGGPSAIDAGTDASMTDLPAAIDSGAMDTGSRPDLGYALRDGQPSVCGDAMCSATQVCQMRAQCVTDPNHPTVLPLPPACAEIPPGCNAPCECPTIFCTSNGLSGSSARCLPDGGVSCGPTC